MNIFEHIYKINHQMKTLKLVVMRWLKVPCSETVWNSRHSFSSFSFFWENKVYSTLVIGLIMLKETSLFANTKVERSNTRAVWNIRINAKKNFDIIHILQYLYWFDVVTKVWNWAMAYYSIKSASSNHCHTHASKSTHVHTWLINKLLFVKWTLDLTCAKFILAILSTSNHEICSQSSFSERWKNCE